VIFVKTWVNHQNKTSTIAFQKNVLPGVQDLSWKSQTKVWTPTKIFIWNTIEQLISIWFYMSSDLYQAMLEQTGE
jgi:hypothetical protein